MKLAGKVAVITGASMGIGEAIAKLFLQEGAKVVLCARDLPRTQAAEQRIGGGANTLSVGCDVSRREQVDALVKAAVAKFGRIDIFVNNAGFGLNDAVFTDGIRIGSGRGLTKFCMIHLGERAQPLVRWLGCVVGV